MALAMSSPTGAPHQLIIYGNGHMATMIAEYVSPLFDVVAFTVDRPLITEESLLGLPLIAFDEIAARFPPIQYQMLIAVGFVAMNRVREEKYLAAKRMGYRLPNYIDPSVRWHSSNSIGENNIILDHTSIHPFTRIGNSNFFSSNINIGHGCIIEDNCWFNAGVSLGGGTRVGNSSVFGINASSSHNIVVAPKTLVGANTFLNKNSEEGDVYLSESGTKFRLKSESFLKFFNVL